MKDHGMFGDVDEAMFIRDWHKLMYRHHRDGGAPKGFRRLGDGCYRTAFLSEKSGAVYKVQHCESSSETNLDEYLNLRSMMLRKVPNTIRFPKYHLLEVEGGEPVAVMEYFPKLLDDLSKYDPQGRTYWDARSKLCDIFPDLWDAHGGNVAIDEEAGKIVPIDIGGYYR